MSSSQTETFGLNQWEADDQVLREEFNRDNSILEAQLTRLSFVTGTYTGTGNGNTQNITLGFAPEALIVFPKYATGVHIYPVMMTKNQPKVDYGGGDVIKLTSTGFQTIYYNRSESDYNPYRYIAWRQL